MKRPTWRTPPLQHALETRPSNALKTTMLPSTFATIKAEFLSIRRQPRVTWADALTRIVDEQVRDEVAAMLAADSDAPLLRPPPVDLADAAPPLVGVTLDARYAVQALVAEGGFGWVFRGRDTLTEAPVAIKLFKPAPDPSVAEVVEAAFLREGEVLRALADQTAHIVRYQAVGTWSEAPERRAPYIVMEWLDGPTLDVWMREHHPDGLSLDASIELLQPVAEAVGAAHTAGVAHRDIKPANILCVGSPDAPVLKLVDFGAAKRAADRARGFDSTGGVASAFTYNYSAPEQLSRSFGSTGPWTDVHALAMVLVELLLGKHPWLDLSVVATMDRILDPKVRPTPKQHGVALPRSVEALFKRALALAPKQRPSDAAAFWAGLVSATGRTPRGRWGRLFRT